MKKVTPSQLLKSQRGAALLIMVAITAIFLTAAVFGAAFYFQSLLVSLNRERDAVVAIQVLQDFAVLAQKANDVYVSTAGVCPGYVKLPLPASHFCWITTNNCVRQTKENFVATGISQYCMSDVSADMSVGSINIEPAHQTLIASVIDTYRQVFAQRHEVLVALELKLLDHITIGLSPTAEAQASFLPVLPGGGPPTAKITPIVCPGGPAQDCKVCAGVNVECIELRICPRNGGCGAAPGAAGAIGWVRQTVGIMPR